MPKSATSWPSATPTASSGTGRDWTPTYPRAPTSLSRQGSGRWPATPYWPSCRETAHQGARHEPAHPAQRHDGGGHVHGAERCEVVARQPADRGDGLSDGRRDAVLARRSDGPGSQGDVKHG